MVNCVPVWTQSLQRVKPFQVNPLWHTGDYDGDRVQRFTLKGFDTQNDTYKIQKVFLSVLLSNSENVNPHLQSSVAETIQQSHGDDAAQDAVQSRQKAGGGCREHRACVSGEKAGDDRRSTRQLFQGALPHHNM